MRVHVIGCNGSFAGRESAASSYLVEHTDDDGRTWRVLFDLGSGAFGTLQRVIDPTELDAVVISHLHPDHYLDLTGLEVFWAYNERQDLPQLPLYGPAALPGRIRAVMDRDDDVPDGLTTVPFDYRSITDRATIEIGPLVIEAREVLHPVESYGFRIMAGDALLVYSGDSDACEALDELAAGADLFLCEAGYIEGRDDRFTGVHLTGRRAGETAMRAGVRRVALTHIPCWTDPAIPEREARAVCDLPLQVVQALDVFEVEPRAVAAAPFSGRAVGTTPIAARR
ncbi:MBL fold metallo-hydrolase [Brachybacterium huguangmaarense]|uniref:MBL fold metallo-hydrolase n=1 Tax=Brachybacterium huguangmaarense TaxID=1652028 RepID=A0ABY6FYC6_9MICO|nr:MBL fold metallo-hydrolase [Brachybacterium huguangmaarense]UYG15840.1 MBL fold metallo-hydrolase [Brachybacterium huguangmaarense]